MMEKRRRGREERRGRRGVGGGSGRWLYGCFFVLEGEGMDEMERNALRLVMGLGLALQADHVAFIQRMQVNDKGRHAMWRERYGARVMQLDKQQGMEIRFNGHVMRVLLKGEK